MGLQGRDAAVECFEKRPLCLRRRVDVSRGGRRSPVLNPDAIVVVMREQTQQRPAHGDERDSTVEGGGRECGRTRESSGVSRCDREVHPSRCVKLSPPGHSERQGERLVLAGDEEEWRLIVGAEDIEGMFDTDGSAKHRRQPRRHSRRRVAAVRRTPDNGRPRATEVRTGRPS